MKLPYGISDFNKLRTDRFLYVDKTAYIEKLEQLGSEYVFFIRPRRFGKSLFLSTLAHYYDINEAEQFERLFDGLYIGVNPTDRRNTYLVLELDFSGMNTDSKEDLQASFKGKLRSQAIGFFHKYRTMFPNTAELTELIREASDVGAILDCVMQEVKKTDKKIYLIIDEYDHFANDIIAMGDGAFYKEIVRAAGFVRDFYETVKIGTKSVIDKIFMTGVSPIMLDDMTSGFNISTNLTTHAAVNGMMGFTDEEVKGIVAAVTPKDMKSKETDETLMHELRSNYNGYLFNEYAEARMYNPDMVLYFLNHWLMTGQHPRQLIDDNVKTDYGRLHRLISNANNRQVLVAVIKNDGITADLVSKFSFDMMYDDKYFVSLLFYMGLLTIDRQEKMRLLLKVPNYVIRTIFWTFIEERLHMEYQIVLDTEALRQSIETMAFDGRIGPYVEYISENVLKPLSNRDLREFDEKYIKVILFAYLMNSRAYRPISERETESGFIDIYLEKDKRIPDVKYEWIIELKYIKKSERSKLAEIKLQGLKQLDVYAASRAFDGQSNVKKALILFVGKDETIVVE